MESIREIKHRIGTVQSTLKITSAMKMVASAKLHHAEAAIEGMHPYQAHMSGILVNFLRSTSSFGHSAYVAVRPVRNVSLVCFASNTALCGGYNANILRELVRLLEMYHEKGLKPENIRIYAVGKKMEESVRHLGYTSQGNYQAMISLPSYAPAYELAEQLTQSFLAGETDRVELLYHRFRSVASHDVVTDTYLPIDLAQMQNEMASDAPASSVDYIVEPSEEELLAALLPEVLKLKLFTALLDAAASEHASRMIAMQTASENAEQLITDLTVQYNKSRQQAITNELLDIVGGSMQ
ncbi:MAG: ATP synthase F1 subunit gamma [Prevotellaceae bacterium]|jgi:F-type H+-transporting ATPase subunit gamma|nr:ATP synthase F1 subunit gamma [Prevotellaceae bacterium]